MLRDEKPKDANGNFVALEYPDNGFRHAYSQQSNRDSEKHGGGRDRMGDEREPDQGELQFAAAVERSGGVFRDLPGWGGAEYGAVSGGRAGPGLAWDRRSG